MNSCGLGADISKRRVAGSNPAEGAPEQGFYALTASLWQFWWQFLALTVRVLLVASTIEPPSRDPVTSARRSRMPRPRPARIAASGIYGS